MDTPRLLVLSGSSRTGSLNRRLATAATVRARALGLDTLDLDLRALSLPIYDGDLEARDGIPDGAHVLHRAVLASDALLLVTPEYNGFPTPLLVNAFDWLSRIPETGPRPSGLASTANRPAGLLSASPGPLGGLRAMNFLRQYLQMAFAMLVVPQQFALGRAHEAFDDAGALLDPKAAQTVDAVLSSMSALARALPRR